MEYNHKENINLGLESMYNILPKKPDISITSFALDFFSEFSLFDVENIVMCDINESENEYFESIRDMKKIQSYILDNIEFIFEENKSFFINKDNDSYIYVHNNNLKFYVMGLYKNEAMLLYTIDFDLTNELETKMKVIRLIKPNSFDDINVEDNAYCVIYSIMKNEIYKEILKLNK